MLIDVFVFIFSVCQGDVGPVGPTGPQGIKGEQGDKGDKVNVQMSKHQTLIAQGLDVILVCSDVQGSPGFGIPGQQGPKGENGERVSHLLL